MKAKKDRIELHSTLTEWVSEWVSEWMSEWVSQAHTQTNIVKWKAIRFNAEKSPLCVPKELFI